MTYVSVNINLDDVAHQLVYGGHDDEDIHDFIVNIGKDIGDGYFTIGLIKALFDSLSDEGKQDALERLQ